MVKRNADQLKIERREVSSYSKLESLFTIEDFASINRLLCHLVRGADAPIRAIATTGEAPN